MHRKKDDIDGCFSLLKRLQSNYEKLISDLTDAIFNGRYLNCNLRNGGSVGWGGGGGWVLKQSQGE